MPELVPSVALVTRQPASFLRRSLQNVFAGFLGHHEHLLVGDLYGRLVLENFTAANHGSVYYGHAYSGCAPMDFGGGNRPCRADSWFQPVR